MTDKPATCENCLMNNGQARRGFGRLTHTPRSNDRIITGAAAGLAERWGVEPTVVRASLGVLSLVGGIGVALYGIAVVISDPAATPNPPTPTGASGPATLAIGQVSGHRRVLAVACVTAIILVAGRSIGLWPGDAIMLGAVAMATGVTLAWLQPDQRVVEWSRRQRTRQGLKFIVGFALIATGVVSLANRTGGLGNVGASAAAIAVVLGGIAVFGAPALGRTLQSLDEERSARIREDERAQLSAHLHDSVLQSLVLIQRSDDPRHMVNLARRQERELRAWLYGELPTGAPQSVGEAIAALVGEIEADHNVRVEAVVVGDQPIDDAARALIAATREAVVNAANHAGVDKVDVFVEADDTELTGFIRDTGIGFNMAELAPERAHNGHRGLADSIVGRVERAGGTAMVESRVGVGTEVELRLPRKPVPNTESP